MKIDFYRHELVPADAEAIARVLERPLITTGDVCRQVERQLGEYFGLPHALLVNSWTNGALACLLAMDLDADDEVILPANTFIATANVVELAGAKVVFADVEPDTLLLTPDIVSRYVTSRTRVVVPVHLYGQMVDIEGLREMLDRHPAVSRRVLIMEDAAHCFEGLRDGYRPGQKSDLAIFSFYATKNVTCGEGGAIVTGDDELHSRIRETRLHGMTAIAADRFSGGRYNHWDMRRLGTKANLPDLLAALLPRQIDTIDARLPERRRVAERYRHAFQDGPLRLVRQLQQCVSAEHIFPLGVPDGQRDAAISALNAAGIPVTVNYRSVPGTAYYRERYGDLTGEFPVSHQWGLDTLTLPLYAGLREDEQAHIIDTVRREVYPLVGGRRGDDRSA